MLDNGVEPVAAHEYGVSKSVYFNDPDGNGFELYYEYPRSNGHPRMRGSACVRSISTLC
jgi:catechol-2,3-dioxygenase